MNTDAIANRLIELRGNKPREEVAKACDISVSALAMYEQGQRIPRDDIKVKLAKYYKRTVQFIFYNKNDTICDITETQTNVRQNNYTIEHKEGQW